MKRVVVMGASGAGKSTFSEELAAAVGASHIDRDRFWSDSVPMESPEYGAAIEKAISVDTWVFDGMPYYVEDLVFPRVDTVVCLDYPKRVVMSRVIRRSLKQSLLRQQVGVHSPQPFKDWRKAEHPVRWAWSTYLERREQMGDWANRPEVRHAKWILLKSPQQASRWLERQQSPDLVLRRQQRIRGAD